MAASRTGTAKWIAKRAHLIRTGGRTRHWCHITIDAKTPRGAPNAIEVDHIIPVTMEDDDEDNLTLSCYTCNRSKSNNVAPGAPRQVADINGVLTRDPRVTCRVHDPILASCPHSGVLH